MGEKCEVAIIGAGPYGLSAAAHLRAAGIETRVFGGAMDFWAGHMPSGMMLRSSWDASHLSDPAHRLRLEDYQHANNVLLERPIPLEGFIDYGRWFQSQVAPDLDRRRVNSIEHSGDDFALTLHDGERLHAARVVVATGIARFAHRPSEFTQLDCQLVSHAGDHGCLSRFARQSVMVIGGGQSAIETAALLSEAGAEVEVVMRAPFLRWLKRSSRLHHLPGRLHRLLYHHTDVGPALLSQLVARPNLFRQLRRATQDRLAYRAIRPAASDWLMGRVKRVRLTMGRHIEQLTPQKNRAQVRLDDGTIRNPHHILLATGYRVDVAQLPFLSPVVRERLATANGYPILRRGMESSIEGLHFVGATGAYSFGPLMRFVSGAEFASTALTQAIVRGRRVAQ